jgi:membrane-bound lytic murein transglycosylase D
MATCFVRRLVAGAGFGLLVALAIPSAAEPKASKHEARSSKSARAAVDANARRTIAGGPTPEDVALGTETPELSALREAERELFPQAAPAPGSPWPSDWPLALLHADAEPVVIASGLPPSRPQAPPPPETGKDLTWLSKLSMPDIPVRWDERVLRYLEFFRDDPRGHTMYANMLRRSGRWREMLRRSLRRKSLPDDLVWVSMIESGFDATARSAAAAVGLWQFTADTAKIYGLTIDRWLDQRLDAPAETEAAGDLLGDLHRRFGSWEMAFAAYDMGYAGLSTVVRRYNTNDFWSLARTEGALPWETALYVPKIVAAAVVANNLATFGFADVALDAPVPTDDVNVPPGTPLALVAQAAGCTLKDLQALNPELRSGRAPPVADGDATAAYAVKVPQGKGASVEQSLVKLRREQPPLERYVVRFGETLDQIATARKTTPQRLVDLNAIAPGEALRGGTLLLVPKAEGAGAGLPTAVQSGGPAGAKPTVVVPPDVFVYPDRKRVFYRVKVGDTLREIAAALHVGEADLDRWNDLDPSARLQEGMTLQAFVAPMADLSRVVVVPEDEVSVLAVGSEEFFTMLEHDKGMKRVTVAAKDGDTLDAIGRRFDVSARTMERINRRGRAEVLKAGDTVVVYVPSGVAAAAGARRAATASNDPAPSGPAPNGPLPPAPVPNLLP